MAESLELSQALSDEFAIQPRYLLNKTLPQLTRMESTDGAFTEYLDDWILRQQQVLQRLSEQPEPVVQIPFCFETELKPQLEQLAEVFDGAF